MIPHSIYISNREERAERKRAEAMEPQTVSEPNPNVHIRDEGAKTLATSNQNPNVCWCKRRIGNSFSLFVFALQGPFDKIGNLKDPDESIVRRFKVNSAKLRHQVMYLIRPPGLPWHNPKSTIITMSNTDTTPIEVRRCEVFFKLFSGRSIARSPDPSFPVPIHDDGTVEWKDVEFDPVHKLSLRLYKPRDPNGSRLPIFYYFHGGGFCIGSRTWPNCQNYCLRLASELQAVIISPDYRLAPEHRLPAAIDDSFSAVKWLHAQSAATDPDTWLSNVADFTRVFISGDSAGGTITHHLAISNFADLAPVRIRGYVLLGPFFGGTQRTKSEAECPKDAFLNLELNDRFWRLSMPIGADIDHPLINPFGPESVSLEKVEIEPMLVVVGGCDLLRDRAVEYAERLKEWGKPVEVAEFEGQQHGFFTIDPWSEPANELMEVVKRFVGESGGGCN
ncbi:probable carboxylesterase 15 isoform X2 [Asparagus officinalis]|uniref:probable carboxylesterase 15 isoform X2 n=1 Tax=Asparagus officinalis TaxID=4686 RepID=UPI00098E1B91|nr:probable carboxylesterase 15 isoform X2 [Asparagus officinalis]